MTGISGHNIIIQQSGAVNEAIHGTNSPKPNPEQIAAQQAADSIKKGTTVQEFDEAERLKAKKEKDDSRNAGKQDDRKKKKKIKDEEKDTEDTGRLLDTII